MAQQDRDLPEGTDSIIPGAMDTDTSDVTGARGTTVAKTPRTSPGGPSPRGGSASGGSGGGSTGSSGGLMDKVREEGSKMTDQAAGKAREFVGQGLDRGSEALSNVSRLVSDTASGLDERLGPEYGDYARRAADAIDRTAQSLRQKDPDELIDDTRNFVRKSPGVALAGAAIVGFALARLIKSGLSSVSDGEGRGQDSSRADASDIDVGTPGGRRS